MKLTTKYHNYCTQCKMHDSRCDHKSQQLGKSQLVTNANIIKEYDDCMSYSVLCTNYVQTKDRKIVGKPQVYVLRIYSNGVMTAKHNHKTVYGFKRLREVLLRVTQDEAMGAHIANQAKIIPEYGSLMTSELLCAYYASRNRTLKDLRIKDLALFFTRVTGYERAKLYKTTRTKGTKAGLEMLTYAKTRALQEYVLQDLNARLYVNRLLEQGFTEDQIVLCLKKYDDSLTLRGRKLVSLYSRAISEYMMNLSYVRSLGFSVKKAMNQTGTSIHQAPDTYRMVKAIQEIDPEYTLAVDSIEKMHESAIRDMRRYQDLIDAKRLGEAAPEHSIPDTEYDDLQIVGTKTYKDIRDCGNEMHICVASYWGALKSGKHEIYYVKRGDKFIACLEVQDGILVQAKLRANRPVANNPDIYEIICQWTVDNDLQVKTYDMVLAEPISTADLQMEIDVDEMMYAVNVHNHNPHILIGDPHADGRPIRIDDDYDFPF